MQTVAMMKRVATGAVVVALAVGIVGAVESPQIVHAAALTRLADPVVLTGSQLPSLVAGSKTTIVGIRWTGTSWKQLPVQVDERAVKNFGSIYHNAAPSFRRCEVRKLRVQVAVWRV